jgi:hypothetical protein
MTSKWISPTDEGNCPACGESVIECDGIELYGATRYEPAGYGCLSVEVSTTATTIILRHETASGDECEVGADNTDEYCRWCDETENRDEYADWEPDPFADDGPLDMV